MTVLEYPTKGTSGTTHETPCRGAGNLRPQGYRTPHPARTQPGPLTSRSLFFCDDSCLQREQMHVNTPLLCPGGRCYSTCFMNEEPEADMGIS